MIFDAHQHFWRYNEADFGWIPSEWSVIQRDFGPAQLHELMKRHGVTSCLAVQARQSILETRMLLGMARDFPFVVGVVGWLPLASLNLQAVLEPLAADRSLVGARHVLQAEPAEFFSAPAFDQGLRELTRLSLVFDLLVTESQFPQTLELVDRHPNLRFVLDHLGKPKFPNSEALAWRSGLRELAKRPNVTCKLSAGMTEIHPQWRPEQLTPLFDAALNAFGPRRLMFGSNWPVCLATGGFEAWLDSVQQWANLLSTDERSWLFEQTARQVYLQRKLS